MPDTRTLPTGNKAWNHPLLGPALAYAYFVRTYYDLARHPYGMTAGRRDNLLRQLQEDWAQRFPGVPDPIYDQDAFYAHLSGEKR